MTLTRQDLQLLSEQLPALVFSSDVDRHWSYTSPVQAYLDFYGINFANEFAGVVHGFGAVSAGDYRIATHYWLPEQPRGTVVVVHGYYDHVGVFGHVIRFALANNFAVLGFDLPGHGLSSGEPAVIDSFNDYGDALAAVLQRSAVILPQPLYAIGQSTGGAVILNYLWRYTQAAPQFTKIALCSPLVVPRAWRGYHMGQYVYALLRHFIKRIRRGRAHSSHDEAFNHFIMDQDVLQAKYLPLRWVGAMKAWHEMFCNFSPLPTALLIVQGTGDMTVDWRYNLPLIQRKLPNAKVVMVADAGHQLVNENETYRTPVFAAIKQYFFN